MTKPKEQMNGPITNNTSNEGYAYNIIIVMKDKFWKLHERQVQYLQRVDAVATIKNMLLWVSNV